MINPTDPTRLNQRANPRPGKRRQLVLMAFVLAGLLAVTVVFDTAARLLFAPWSISTGGRPIMLGDWSGAVTLENGVTGTLRLSLEDSFDQQESFFEPLVEGVAVYCLGERVGEFELYGMADRQGNIDNLGFRSNSEAPIWLLHGMSSQWDGERLTLRGTYSYDLTAAHIARSDVPEAALVVVLEPATADEACVLKAP